MKQSEFAFEACISEFKFGPNPGLSKPSFEQPGHAGLGYFSFVLW